MSDGVAGSIGSAAAGFGLASATQEFGAADVVRQRRLAQMRAEERARAVEIGRRLGRFPAPGVPKARAAVGGVPMVATLVAPEVPAAPQRLTARQVARRVAAKHGVSFDALVSATRNVALVRIRHEAMYCARVLAHSSFMEIARVFDRDHTTVLHAVAQHALRAGLPDWTRADRATVLASIGLAPAPVTDEGEEA